MARCKRQAAVAGTPPAPLRPRLRRRRRIAVTQGDPAAAVHPPGWHGPDRDGNPPPLNPVIFQQQTGIGGQAAAARGHGHALAEGAVPGPTVFVDARTDERLRGVGVRYDTFSASRQFSVPIGGGAAAAAATRPTPRSAGSRIRHPENDNGGGGGGGGGVLIVKALGDIIIATAAASPPTAARAAAAAVLGAGAAAAAAAALGHGHLDVGQEHRDQRQVGQRPDYSYRDNDYDFAISADGGVCVTGNAPPVVPASIRRAAPRSPSNDGDLRLGAARRLRRHGHRPADGPAPEELNSDNTNTVLDDNIRVLTGVWRPTANRRSICSAWLPPTRSGKASTTRGSRQNPQGLDEGDPPRPHLLPTPFASSSSRLRSKWIDTRDQRRALLLDDNLPRGSSAMAPSLAPTDGPASRKTRPAWRSVTRRARSRKAAA